MSLMVFWNDLYVCDGFLTFPSSFMRPVFSLRLLSLTSIFPLHLIGELIFGA